MSLSVHYNNEVYIEEKNNKLNIKTQDLAEKYFMEQISYNLINLISIFNNRCTLIKIKAFSQLSNLIRMREKNKRNALILYEQLKTAHKTIIYFLKRKYKLLLTKRFIKWRNITTIFNKSSEWKREISLYYEKKQTKDNTNLENLVKKKEKENTDLVTINEKSSELAQELSKKINALEEKENNYLGTINHIDMEKKRIIEELNKKEIEDDCYLKQLEEKVS